VKVVIHDGTGKEKPKTTKSVAEEGRTSTGKNFQKVVDSRISVHIFKFNHYWTF
jgi:hypothetical protein